MKKISAEEQTFNNISRRWDIDRYAVGFSRWSKRERLVLWFKVLWKKYFSREERRDKESLSCGEEEVNFFE